MNNFVKFYYFINWLIFNKHFYKYKKKFAQLFKQKEKKTRNIKNYDKIFINIFFKIILKEFFF